MEISGNWVLAIGLAAVFQAQAAGSSLSKAADVVGDYVMTDFEGMELRTPINGYWYTFTDRNTATSVDSIYGNSRLTTFDSSGRPLFDTLGNPDPNTFPAGHSEESLHSLKFGYELGDRKLSCGAACTYEPYVGMGIRFTTMADTLDLTGAVAITFWAKADSAPLTLNVSIGTMDTTTNAADYGQAFKLTTSWAKYTITLKASADFKQPSWAAVKPFNIQRVFGMGFGVNRGENATKPSNAVYVDDITIENWKYVDPYEVGLAGTGTSAGNLGANSFRVDRKGGLLQVGLPSAYRGKRGTLEALGVDGRLLTAVEFLDGSEAVPVRFDGAAAIPGRVFFRVVAGGTAR
jgi:hypothetical protein